MLFNLETRSSKIIILTWERKSIHLVRDYRAFESQRLGWVEIPCRDRVAATSGLHGTRCQIRRALRIVACWPPHPVWKKLMTNIYIKCSICPEKMMSVAQCSLILNTISIKFKLPLSLHHFLDFPLCVLFEFQDVFLIVIMQRWYISHACLQHYSFHSILINTKKSNI